MKLAHWKDEVKNIWHYNLELNASDLAEIDLDRYDMALLSECEDGSIADKLIGLECIARKIESVNNDTTVIDIG